MHGPHALARTIPPISLSGLSTPSLSMVALICSEPGVMVNADLKTVMYTMMHRETSIKYMEVNTLRVLLCRCPYLRTSFHCTYIELPCFHSPLHCLFGYAG